VNYLESVFGEIEFWKFFSGKPADFGGVAGGEEFASEGPAEIINQHIVILHTALGIAQDAVVYTEQFAGFDKQSRFFAGFADGGFANHLANFENTAGDGPVSLDGRVSTLDQNHAIAFDDDGTDADKGEFGEFAFHDQGSGARGQG